MAALWAAIAALALADYGFTKRRLRLYGPLAELNPLAAKQPALAILGVTAVLLVGFSFWEPLLYLLLSVRLLLFTAQLHSLGRDALCASRL